MVILLELYINLLVFECHSQFLPLGHMVNLPNLTWFSISPPCLRSKHLPHLRNCYDILRKACQELSWCAPRLNTKTVFARYEDSYVTDKTVLFLHGDRYTGKTVSLYWDGPSISYQVAKRDIAILCGKVKATTILLSNSIWTALNTSSHQSRFHWKWSKISILVYQSLFAQNSTSFNFLYVTSPL